MVRAEDLPRARACLEAFYEWLGAYKTAQAKIASEKLRRKNDRYILFDRLSGEEQLFDLGRAKLILAGAGGSNGEELVVLTEDDHWVIVHAPLPGVTETGVPAPPRRAIQLEPADVTWWSQSDRYGAFDQRGQPVALDGLPEGLIPSLHESWRIAGWRQGLPVGERGRVRTGIDHSDEKGWIVGTRSELNRALGMSRKYPKYLEMCQRLDFGQVDWQIPGVFLQD